MSRLMPPPQRDLPEADRREIRAAVVRTTRATPRPRHGGRVVVPALALTGVVGVAAAVGLNVPGNLGLPGTGMAVPAGPVPTATATPDQTPGSPTIPAAQPIDRGPLSSSAKKEIIKSCLHGTPGNPDVAQVHLARQTSTNGAVVLLTDSTGSSHICTDHRDSAGLSAFAGGAGAISRPDPSRRRPVVQQTGPSMSASLPATARGTIRGYSETSYRVGPDVASLQLRLTVEGHTGPWFEASVSGGYAWAGASVEYTGKQHGGKVDYHVDDRAFDAAGHELDIDHVRR